MFYRCKKVQHKPINIQVRDQIQRSKETWVWCGLAHRTVRCATGLCPVHHVRTKMNQPLSGFQQTHFAIIHRIVRCTSGATAIQRNSRLQWHPDSAAVENSARQSQSAESEAHRTVNKTCPVWHRTVRCAHRQQPSPTACWWLRAINTPQPPQLQASMSSEVFIQYKS
jgi:hypothetical protein